ncbi:LacI family DNA-binding transcriptional regulator [Microbacterium sp. NPDC058389]|uniref:LacI family DNA-binding transcriptional regulator n=1 Tax=Microbacterium sp. NPDC058389 TaxID=3346475 RepID=UPI00365AF1E5
MARKADRLPTIIDIARATGLSKSVVSRALNGEPGVSPESREIVTETASQMGYVTNAIARKMRTQGVDTVGVLVRDPASVFYGALLGALQSAAAARGVRLLTMTGSGKPDLEEERSALRSLLTLRVDGLLVCSGLLPASDLYPFADRVPTVVVGRSEWDTRISSVCCDDEDGARQIVDYVIEAGFTQIVVPIPPAATAPSLHVRGNLLAAAAQTRGLHPHLMPSDSPQQFANQFAGRDSGPIALLAPNDHWAVRIREELGDRAGRLVTGYDGVGIFTTPLLHLTTIVQPIDAIAASALDLVVDILTKERSAEHLSLAGSLRVAT